MRQKQTVICCSELKEAVANSDMRYNKKGNLCIGTNAIWYCPFCGEDICWRYENENN